VAGQFPDDVWEVFCRFVEYARQLLNTSIVSDSSHVNATLRFRKDEGLTTQVTIPSSDRVCAFLHRMRPFVLQDEPTNFYKVCNLISRHVDNVAVRDAIKSLKSLYSGEEFRSQVRMDLGSVLVNCEGTLKKWLNGFEYHKDKSKQEEIQLLGQLLPQEYLRAIFVSMTLDMAKAVLRLSKLVEMLENQDVAKGIPNI